MSLPTRVLRGQPHSFTIEHGLLSRAQGPQTMSGAVPADCRVLESWVLPPFQRMPAWSRAQQVRFIESIWLGIPVSTYVYNSADESHRGAYRTDMRLIDGQQRWTAIYDYVDDGFPAFDLLYSQLTVAERRRFGMTVFPCIKTTSDDEAWLLELYMRLAYGGTAHAAPKLRPDGTPECGR